MERWSAPDRAAAHPQHQSEELTMLSRSRAIPVLLATDLSASRAFYADKLGLPIEQETDSAVTFACADGTAIRISESSEGTKDSQTQLDLTVADVRAEVAELRSRGVTIEEYDNDEVHTEDGVADQGDAWVAWITDPGGNVIGIEQPKQSS
jgi:catechol 2,3-dioxygenase-like lactoylglutathione lyase family enzyme